MRPIIGVGLLLVGGMCGCAEDRRDAPGSAQKPPQQTTSEEVKRDVDQAAETTSQYLDKKREEFRRNWEQQMAELDGDIERLKQRASEVREDARPRWEAAMKELEVKRTRARASSRS